MRKEKKKCIGCGQCCKNQVCKIGQFIYSNISPCPGLLFIDGRYWCKLVMEISDKKLVDLESYMTIGFGCEWLDTENNPLTYTMEIKCAWCGKDMEVKPCNEDQQNKISHGICPKCKTKMEKEISEYDDSNI